MEVITRSPKGAECQCAADGCGLFFSSESAFERHWTKNGHASPESVGLVVRDGPRGPVWGWPGMSAEVLAARREGSTAIDSRAVPGSERPSEPRPPSAASRGSGDLSAFNPGERGPGGGVVAQCVACRGLWERPKQRGRPSLKCEGCRG